MRRRKPKQQPPLKNLDEDEPLPHEAGNLLMAIRLRFAIGHSYNCPDKECRRRHICMRPVLQCECRPLADIYDWDYGWFNCKRKEVYEVREDAWMPGIMGGTAEFRQQQEDDHMQDRATLDVKMVKP